MGTRELVAKIRDDARIEAERIRAEASAELARIEQRRQEQVAQLEQEYVEKTASETRLILERARSRARVAARNRVLEAKWAGVEQVMKLAAERVVEDKQYLPLIRALGASFADKQSTVRFSEQDTARMARSGRLKPGESADIAGGLIVEQGRMTLDFSLDRALAALKENLARQVSGILFPTDMLPDAASAARGKGEEPPATPKNSRRQSPGAARSR